MTLGKNFWQCLERNEIQPVCQFFSKQQRMVKFEKYQSAILGLCSSDFVANIEKKLGKTFSLVCMGLFKKASQKSGILIKTGQILPKFWSF